MARGGRRIRADRLGAGARRPLGLITRWQLRNGALAARGKKRRCEELRGDPHRHRRQHRAGPRGSGVLLTVRRTERAASGKRRSPGWCRGRGS